MQKTPGSIVEEFQKKIEESLKSSDGAANVLAQIMQPLIGDANVGVTGNTVYDLTHKQFFVLEKVERFYYLSSRNGKKYMEISFWYDPNTLTRKETTREEYINDGEEHKLPDWCKVCEYRKSLNYQ